VLDVFEKKLRQLNPNLVSITYEFKDFAAYVDAIVSAIAGQPAGTGSAAAVSLGRASLCQHPARLPCRLQTCAHLARCEPATDTRLLPFAQPDLSALV
jgi:hypothetical protein